MVSQKRKEPSMYRRLSMEERETIAKELARGYGVTAIADKIKRSRTTIYREVHRLRGTRDSYVPSHAQEDARIKQQFRRKGKTKLVNEHWYWIEEHLRKRWSPEEISNNLRRNSQPGFQVSRESIYQYIYSQEGAKRKELIACLRHRKKRRKRRKSFLERRGKIKNALSIHKRPKEVEKRKTFGHWEGDLIIGKDHQTAIGTLVERKSRYVKIVPLFLGKDSLSVVKSFANKLLEIPSKLKKSLTYDRGLEMALHQFFTKITGITVYFADPRYPWQRGTNENTNGLIRDFFPKKTDFSNYTEEDFQEVEDLLNDRPRKVNGFRTPREVFEGAYCH